MKVFGVFVSSKQNVAQIHFLFLHKVEAKVDNVQSTAGGSLTRKAVNANL